MFRITVFLWSGLLLPLPAEVLRVDPSASTPGDGSSWPSAFADLQPALAAADAGDEIWVAAGTYTPGTLRTGTFALKSGVAVYGGFPAGGGDGTFAARNSEPDSNATILSGEIGTPDDPSDNAYHVVTGTGADGSATLDAFTIRDGNADGDPGQRQHLGGGIVCDGSGSPQLRNLLVTRNQANGIGGGMYLNGASPTFTDVVFRENRTTTAGSGVTGEGGAAYLNFSNPTFTGGAFLGNVAATHGGALSLHNASTTTYTNVTFVGNTASGSSAGGAINFFADSYPTLIHCAFVGNRAGAGGAMLGDAPLLRNSIVWGNQATHGPQLNGAPPIRAVSTSNLVEGFSYTGGTVVASSNPRFVFHPFTSDGDWTTWDDNHYGDLRLRAGSPAIDSGDSGVSSPPEDADGLPRPFDGDQDGGAAPDLGPHEFSEPPAISPDGEIHRWTFSGDGSDAIGDSELVFTNGAAVRDGHLVLDGVDDFAVTAKSSPVLLAERTFVAWVDPANLTQRRGGVLTIVRDLEGVADTFDGIVYAERTERQWMNGSSHGDRTVTNNGGAPETVSGGDKVMIAITYGPGDAINLFRNGQPYNTVSATKGTRIDYRVGETAFHLGQRHPGTTDSQRFFAGRIDEARVYSRALSAGEILALHNEGPVPDPPASPVDSADLTADALARQSATGPVPFPDRSHAGLAIDGLTTSNDHCVAVPTDTEPAAWIEVELAADSLVERVEVANLTFPLNATCCYSRLRDITIELRDATGAVVASSPLLNPENEGYTFPNGPHTLAHEFAAAIPARFVRVTRTPDPDLSGSRGRGSPVSHEAGHLEPSEIRVFGESLETNAVPAFAATFDSRRADPDPEAQLWFDTETIAGGDFSPADGLIDTGANVGIVTEGTESIWQINDQLSDGSYNNPWNRNLLDTAELRQLFDLGWTFRMTVRAVSDESSGNAGGAGWGFSAARNPGWDIGANGDARVLFNIGRNAADDSFYVTPQSQPTVTLEPGSGADYHTITAVGAPRSTLYEWFIDGVSQGTIDFATVDVGGLTSTNLSFGSGSSGALGRVSNWKRVSLASIDQPAPADPAGLLFHLPFEPGASGNERLTEKSRAPGAKPAVTEINGSITSIDPGAQGQGVTFPGGAFGSGPPALDASPALSGLAGLDTATLSVWLRPTSPNSQVLAFTDTSETASYSALTISNPGAVPSLRFATIRAAAEVGENLIAPAPGLLDGRWHHAAVTVSASETRLYFDGRIIASADGADATGFTAAIPGIDAFTIADLYNASSPSGDFPYSGALDEVAIWNRALPATEIASLYQRGYLGAPLVLDRDGDSLNFAEETALGTDDGHADTDGDGIPDAEEIVLRTDPTNADTDGDGIPDDVEIANGTNPRLADSDGDGFADSAEASPLDPTAFPDTTSPDTDGDGLTDAAEASLGTDPDLADSDDDTFSDFVEILLGTDPNDPASTPDVTDSDGDGLTDAQEAALGTDPGLADSDGDTFSDHAEVNAGSDPNSGASLPDSAILTNESFVLLENGDVTLTFRIQGAASNVRLQSSSDLASFPDLASAAVTPLGGGRYRITATPPPGHRFFRAAADGEVGTVTGIAVNLDLPLDATSTPITSLEAEEGATFSQRVLFSAPFTGYLSFTLTGITPNGDLLPTLAAGISLTNATSAEIPLHLFNDLIAGPQTRYTVTLTDNPGLVPGLDSSFTLSVNDDDARWSGTLGVAGEQLNFVLESLTDGTTTTRRLAAPDSSSLFPRGTFPITANFGSTTFSAATGNIPLLRELPDITAAPATITGLQLAANDAETGQDVAPNSISGAATVSLAPPSGNPATVLGSFHLEKQPPPPPSTDLNLAPSP